MERVREVCREKALRCFGEKCRFGEQGVPNFFWETSHRVSGSELPSRRIGIGLSGTQRLRRGDLPKAVLLKPPKWILRVIRGAARTKLAKEFSQRRLALQKRHRLFPLGEPAQRQQQEQRLVRSLFATAPPDVQPVDSVGYLIVFQGPILLPNTAFVGGRVALNRCATQRGGTSVEMTSFVVLPSCPPSATQSTSSRTRRPKSQGPRRQRRTERPSRWRQRSSRRTPRRPVEARSFCGPS